jgi:hypothetical protein
MKCHRTRKRSPGDETCRGYCLEHLPQYDMPWNNGVHLAYILQQLTLRTRSIVGETFVWTFEEEEIARLKQAAVLIMGDTSKAPDIVKCMLMEACVSQYNMPQHSTTPVLHWLNHGGDSAFAVVYATYAHGCDLKHFPENTNEGIILTPHQTSQPQAPRPARQDA